MKTPDRPVTTIDGMLERLGWFCFRRRRLILAGWLLVVVIGGASAGPLMTAVNTARPAQGTESDAGLRALEEAELHGLRFDAVIDGADPGTRAAVARASGEVRAIDGVREVGEPALSTDGAALTVPVVLERLDDPYPTLDAATGRMRAIDGEVPGSQVRLGGADLVADDTNRLSGEDLTRAELYSLPVTLIVLALIFGGLAGAGVPVLAALAAITGSMGMLLAASQVTPLDNTVMSVVTLLGLGLSIDYALLLTVRYREELAAGHDRETALGRCWATAGRTILFSGLIVVAALPGLLLIPMPRLQAMGAAGIAAAAVALLAALTLTGALIAVLGRFIKPLKVKPMKGGSRMRPVPVIAGTLAVLLLAGSPVLATVLQVPGLKGIPPTVESVRVTDELSTRFGQTQDPPLQIIARTTPQELDAYAQRWVTDPDVARVEPARAAGGGFATVSVLVRGAEQGDRASALLDRMRADRPAGAESWVAGSTANRQDLIDRIAAGLPAAIAVTLIAMVVLLFLMTGSVTVPITAIVLNVVSLSATFGILVAVFQWGWLAGPLDTLTMGGLSPYLLVSVFAFAFAFSMDYGVFLLGRIKEYVDSGCPPEEAVRRGLRRTARVISAAAVAMLIVFAGFGMATLADLEQVGIALFVAVLVDATLVRCLLLPATMTVLGRWAWWAPRPLLRLRELMTTRPGHRTGRSEGGWRTPRRTRSVPR